MEWWQRTLRIADFPLPELASELIAAAVSRKKELQFDAEYLVASEARNGERGIFHFASKAAGEVRPDFLGPYIKEAHGSGIKVFVSLNVHWMESSFAAAHQDWLQRGSDARAIDDVYGKGCAPCVNSPEYRAWSFQLIRDLARYAVDGVLLDGPGFQPSGCWCEGCRSGFREHLGKELPPREDWEDAAWKELIEFRYDSTAGYVRDARAVLKKGRPEAVMVATGQGLSPGWQSGRDNRRLVPYQDVVAAEPTCLPGEPADEPLWRLSMSAKLLETQAAGKPTVLSVAGSRWGWLHTSLTPEETLLRYAQAIAHGSSPRYCLPYELSAEDGARAAGRMNAFIKRNARFLDGTSSVAGVALLWSARTADYYRGAAAHGAHPSTAKEPARRNRSVDPVRAFSGWFECLARKHVQFDVLDEQAIEETLDRYSVLILPNVACISQKHAAAITSWVESGGALVSTFETSLYTDWGVRRSTPALHDAIGVDCSGIEGPAETDYFERTEEPLFASVSSPLIPAPRYRALVQPSAPGSRVLSYYGERLRVRTQPLPARSAHPAIVENRLGRGRSLYFAGTLDEAYREYHFPEHAALLSWLAEDAGPHDLLLEAPETVQAVLRRQRSRRRLLVHLLNATGEMARPIRSILPVQRLKVAFPGVRAASSALYAAPGGETPIELPIKTRRAGGIEITVPRLDAYGLLILEGAPPGHGT